MKNILFSNDHVNEILKWIISVYLIGCSILATVFSKVQVFEYLIAVGQGKKLWEKLTNAVNHCKYT